MTEKSWDDSIDNLDFNSEEDNVVEHTEIKKPNTIPAEEITSKLKNKYELKLECVEYWANKIPISKSRREASIEDLERWSKIGKSNNGDKLETFADNNQNNCKLCRYTCKMRITLIKHVNTKHGHGYGEPQ